MGTELGSYLSHDIYHLRQKYKFDQLLLLDNHPRHQDRNQREYVVFNCFTWF